MSNIDNKNQESISIVRVLNSQDSPLQEGAFYEALPSFVIDNVSYTIVEHVRLGSFMLNTESLEFIK